MGACRNYVFWQFKYIEKAGRNLVPHKNGTKRKNELNKINFIYGIIK